MRIASLFLFLCAMSASVTAQQKQESEEPIIVTGTRPADTNAAQKFVNGITLRSESQIARFHQPICPAAIGLASEFGTLIEARIRQNALDVGLKVADLHCSANLIVFIVLVDDGLRLATSLLTTDGSNIIEVVFAEKK